MATFHLDLVKPRWSALVCAFTGFTQRFEVALTAGAVPPVVKVKD